MRLTKCVSMLRGKAVLCCSFLEEVCARAPYSLQMNVNVDGEQAVVCVQHNVHLKKQTTALTHVLLLIYGGRYVASNLHESATDTY